MIILIDGYNLLKQIFPKIKGVLDKQRTQLIKELGYYKKKKDPEIKDIILVFDAGAFNHASREIKDGIIVIFSGQKSSADEWIIAYVNKHPSEEILLITLDRKLKESCSKPHVHTLDVFQFYTILQENLYTEIIQNLTTETPAKKYTNTDLLSIDEEIPNLKFSAHSKALDLLMEEATISTPSKDKEEQRAKASKGNAFKLSKKDKNFLNKIKKIR